MDSTPLKKSVLSVVIVAIFADMLMYGIIVPFLPLHAESLGASQSEIGLLFASYAIALFIATPFVGALADRLGRKKMLVAGLIVLSATTLVYAFSSSFLVLVLARAMQGVAAAAPWTAGLSLLAEVFPANERGRAMGIAMSGQAGGILLGPPAGGWLYEWGGYRLPFLIAAGIALLAATISVVLLRHLNDTKADKFISPFRLLRSKRVIVIAGVATVGAALFASIEPTLPIHFNEDLHLSPSMIGLMFVVVTLIYGVAAPWIGSLSTRLGHLATIRLGIVMAAVALPLNALPKQIWVQIIGLIGLGISLGLVLTPALPKLADISQEMGVSSQGATFAAYNTAYSLGMMLGPLLASALTDRFGLTAAYMTLSVLFLIYLLPLRKLKA
ncbi:MFS transporter [Paenibacillus sp. alder61]|uniref:MFS transporter n=1 Tax=Paenibacillus sp. alder61 TaxID=2862948 RepID=UPI001CD79E62|nr:MFS transporter [Paenibacillus sp. alder61]MCA1295805.1 MFS transporter [Paenibacillus sp. alder61]